MKSAASISATITPIAEDDMDAEQDLELRPAAITVHRVYLQPDSRNYDGDVMLFNGKAIGKSERPLYDAARWLLASGAARGNDMVETYRGGTLIMRGIAGFLAGRTVVEANERGPARWTPYPGVPGGPKVGETEFALERRRRAL